MIALTIMAGLLVAVLGGWLLTETVRSGRSRWWLALALPVLLAWPVGIHVYGSSLLGYAATDALDGDFALIHAFADEGEHAVYALVRLKGGTEPRLYRITGDYERNRKGFAAAQAQAGKGVPMAGRKREGVRDEGEYVFYVLPASGVPDKG